MPDGFGVSFAPTADNAMDASRQGQLEGLPAAIKILSLRMPRFLGAKGIAPDALMGGQGGGGGEDPFASSVMQTLFTVLTGGSSTPNPVITPGVDNGLVGGGEFGEVAPPPPAGPPMGGGFQGPRRVPRGPGSIMRGNQL